MFDDDAQAEPLPLSRRSGDKSASADFDCSFIEKRAMRAAGNTSRRAASAIVASAGRRPRKPHLRRAARATLNKGREALSTTMHATPLCRLSIADAVSRAVSDERAPSTSASSKYTAMMRRDYTHYYHFSAYIIAVARYRALERATMPMTAGIIDDD